MECFQATIMNTWENLSLIYPFIYETFKTKPFEATGALFALTALIIAYRALGTWKESLHTESNIRLQEQIIEISSEWYIAVMDAFVTAQPARRKDGMENQIISDAGNILNNASATLMKLHISVDCHAYKHSKEKTGSLLNEIQNAMDLNEEIHKEIKKKWTVDLTSNNPDLSADTIALFKKINNNETPKTFSAPPFSKVRPQIKAITEAANFLLPCN